jgi:hypothetical protein
VLTLSAAAVYLREQTLSGDFRKAAVEALAQLESFEDTESCAGIIIYNLGVQRISLAVHQAEVLASTRRDKEAVASLQIYYHHVVDRALNCGEGKDLSDPQAYLKAGLERETTIDLDEAFLEGELGLEHREGRLH